MPKAAGFSLHAGVAVRGGDRKTLERLCHYITRPALAEGRLSLTPQGRPERGSVRRSDPLPDPAGPGCAGAGGWREKRVEKGRFGRPGPRFRKVLGLPYPQRQI
jgi:hypothetical protein